jgi:hypothetical protein
MFVFKKLKQIKIRVSARTIKPTKKVHGVKEHTEKQFQKYFVPGNNIAIDESTVGFKGMISFESYSLKRKVQNGSLWLFILTDSGSGYVQGIIPSIL